MNNYPQAKKQGGLAGIYKRFPILCTLMIMGIIVVAVLVGATLFLNLWTHHGSTAKVPDVKGMTLDGASHVLEAAGLDMVVSDSIYDDNIPGGTVVEVWPKPGAVVKGGREVYLTIVSFSPRMVIIDMPLTDISMKQAQNYLNSHGISSIGVEYVESEFPQMVLSAKVNGEYVTLGSRIPANSTVVLQVGRSPEPVSFDDALDAQIDSIIQSEDTDPYFE